jgi:hypothetical protein
MHFSTLDSRVLDCLAAEKNTSGASLSGRKHDAGFLDPAFMFLPFFG